MAWQVALVVDTEYSLHELSFLVRQMPVWAERTAAAPSIRNDAGEIWSPEPSLTLFAPGAAPDRETACLHVLGTVQEHHPFLAFLELIGVSASQR